VSSKFSTSSFLPDLEQVLRQGNTTGTNNIIYSTNTEARFRDTNTFIRSNSTGNLLVEASTLLTLGVVGDTTLGDGTLRVLRPDTNARIDLGTSAARFNKGFYDDDVETNSTVIGLGGLRTKVSTDNVSSPPTDAQLDTAFGTPATVGEGFIGIVDDNDAETAVWLCVAVGTSWWYEALTKAV